MYSNDPNYKPQIGFIMIIFFLLYSGILAQDTYLRGTFLEFKEVENISDPQLIDLLDELITINIDTVIIKYTGKMSNGSIDSATNLSRLDWLLGQINSKGMHAFLGLYLVNTSEAWWRNDNYINQNIARANSFNNSLSNNYEGYYITQEIDFKSHLMDSVGLYMDNIIDGIKLFDSSRDIIIGGFMKNFTNVTCHMDTTQLQTRLDTLFYYCDPDIFILQDGVGAFDNPMLNAIGGNNLGAYLSVAKSIAESHSTLMWVVTELFQWDGAYPDTSATHVDKIATNLRRLNYQIYEDRKYSDNGMVLSWITYHHMTTYNAFPLVDYFTKGSRHLLRAYKANYFGNHNFGEYYNPADDSLDYKYIGIQPSATYPDPDTTKLLNHRVGQLTGVTWNTDEWVGFILNNNQTITIEVDLKSYNNPVSDISVVAMTRPDWGIVYPADIEVSVCNESTKRNWSILGSMISTPHSDYGRDDSLATWSSHSRATLIVSEDNSMLARYVRIKLFPNQSFSSSWMFLSEIEVFGIPASSSKNLSENSKETNNKSDISFNMIQNYPNPFNPITTIAYSLPEKALVTIKVYNILGREVAELVNGYTDAGTYNATFNGSNLASGMYVVSFKAGEYSQSQKILLMK